MGAVVARRLQVVGGLMRHRSLQIGRTWSALLIAICFRTGRRTGECWSQVYGGGGCTAVTGGGGSHAPSLAPAQGGCCNRDATGGGAAWNALGTPPGRAQSNVGERGRQGKDRCRSDLQRRVGSAGAGGWGSRAAPDGRGSPARANWRGVTSGRTTCGPMMTSRLAGAAGRQVAAVRGSGGQRRPTRRVCRATGRRGGGSGRACWSSSRWGRLRLGPGAWLEGKSGVA